MVDAAAWVTVVYGLLVLVGGLIGYLKAKSRPSLIAGGIFGAALIAVGLAGSRGWGPAPWVACGLALALLVMFGMRYARKKKFMPAGFLAILSLIALAANLMAAFRP